MEVARSVSERGEVVLRRREHDGALELRVNGVFVMDTIETSSERELARATLAAVDPATDALEVLVGGLGLGFTLAEVLTDPRVARVLVVEIEPDLVHWHRAGLIPHTAAALRDPRSVLVVDDVRRTVATQPPASLDLLLLDVDNGPGYLVYHSNAEVYEQPFLSAARTALKPGGVIAVWSMAEAPVLAALLDQVFGAVEELVVPVRLGTRASAYHVFVGRR